MIIAPAAGKTGCVEGGKCFKVSNYTHWAIVGSMGKANKNPRSLQDLILKVRGAPPPAPLREGIGTGGRPLAD